MVEAAGTRLYPRPVDRTCSLTVNRPVRTRMPGGVGAGGIQNPPATRLDRFQPIFTSPVQSGDPAAQILLVVTH